MTAFAEWSAPPPLALLPWEPPARSAPLLDTSEDSRTWNWPGIPADADNERLPLDESLWPEKAKGLLGRLRRWTTVQDRLADACERLLAAGADLTPRQTEGAEVEPIEASNGSIPARVRGKQRLRHVDAEHGWAHADSDAGILANWLPRLRACSQAMALVKCAETGRVGAIGDCCRCPVCPRQQRRRAAEQRAAMRWMLSNGFPACGGRHPTHRRRHLSLHEQWRRAEGLMSAEEERNVLWHAGDRAKDRRAYGWKMLTLPFRNSGNLDTDIATALRLRALLVKRLRAYLDAPVDGWGAVEVSPSGFVHLHCLLWLPLVHEQELAALRRWLRSATCDADGCRHDGDECRGSFVVDVRSIYDKRRKLRGQRRRMTAADWRDAWTNAVMEAVKYATAPMSEKQGKLSALTADDAERNVRVCLAMWKKHRVESYGMARKKTELAPDPEESELAVTPEELGIRRPVVLAYLRRVGPYLMVIPPPPRQSASSLPSIGARAAPGKN